MVKVKLEVNGCNLCSLNEFDGKYDPQNPHSCALYQLAKDRIHRVKAEYFPNNPCSFNYGVRADQIPDFTDKLRKQIDKSGLELISMHTTPSPN